MNIKKLTKDKSPRDVAIAIMDVAHGDFNESNFNYYDYFFKIRYYITVLKNDGIITQEQHDAINEELKKLSLEMIVKRDELD